MSVTLTCTHAKIWTMTMSAPNTFTISYALGYETGGGAVYHDVLIDAALTQLVYTFPTPGTTPWPDAQTLCDMIADDINSTWGSKPTHVYIDGVEMTPTP